MELIQNELEGVLARRRYGHRAKGGDDARASPGIGTEPTTNADGHVGKYEITVPRARLDTSEDKTTDWRSSTLRAISVAPWRPMR